MKFILIVAVFGTFYILVYGAIERSYARGFAEGRGIALKTNPPSEELEMTCAGMWMGQQNQKYFQKTK
jgi:hypothetical protein